MADLPFSVEPVMVINLYPDEPTMSQDQVKALFQEVQSGMTEHVKASLVEVYYPSASNPDFMENGTGSFVEIVESQRKLGHFWGGSH